MFFIVLDVIMAIIRNNLQMGTSYHPQSSGQVQELNQTIEQIYICLFSEVNELRIGTSYSQQYNLLLIHGLQCLECMVHSFSTMDTIRLHFWNYYEMQNQKSQRWKPVHRSSSKHLYRTKANMQSA